MVLFTWQTHQPCQSGHHNGQVHETIEEKKKCTNQTITREKSKRGKYVIENS